jgi:excisionase family DNA binding protein
MVVQSLIDEEPLLLTMKKSAIFLGCARSTLYQLVRDGQIVQVHLGRAARIPTAALREFVARKYEVAVRRREAAEAWELMGRRRRGGYFNDLP